MTNLHDLAERLDKAAEAYDRVIAGAEDMSPGGAAIAGAMVLTMHGHLFAAAAAAIRSRINGGENG